MKLRTILGALMAGAASYLGTRSALAGSVDWAAPAADLSGSLQQGAYEAVPLGFTGICVASGFHMQNVVPMMIGGTVALYGAAHSDLFQTVIGDGGGGGLITAVIGI